MDHHGDTQSHVDPIDPRVLSAKRSLLVVAPANALFQGLVMALKSRFLSYDVHLVDDASTVNAVAGRSSLILLYAEPHRESDTAHRCRRQFPSSTIGLILDASADDFCNLHPTDLVQGYLPLSMELEVWLAAVTVLLSGRAFYPVEQRPAARHQDGRPQLQPARNREGLAGTTLTRREHQVLALLSEGLQNKLIADRMTLSEHTVKIHVHNLITKLHVSNRTQAAAFFRSAVAQRHLPLAETDHT